jgi:ABC-type sugar transport system substrate-binding protein
MLNRRNFLTAAVGVAAAGGLAACAKEDEGGSSSSDGSGGGKKITLGFAQVGSESGWRTANTKSVKAAAKESGYTLKFSDAQQKQENQISAIRSYIAQKVDVIAFSPVVVTGWDAVLKEAKSPRSRSSSPTVPSRPPTTPCTSPSSAPTSPTRAGARARCWRRSSRRPATRAR